MNTQDKIALLKKLHGESTPGEWGISPDAIVWKPATRPLVDVSTGSVRHIDLPDRTMEDAQFIAASHNHLPEILAELDALTQDRDTLRALAANYKKEVERLRAALCNIEGCNSPSCNCADLAKAALVESK